MLHNWFGRMFSRTRRQPVRRLATLWARPRIEALEDRVVPSTVGWTGGTSSDWAVGTNWSGGATPGSGDIAVINGNGSNAPVLSSAATVGGLQMHGGTLTLNADLHLGYTNPWGNLFAGDFQEDGGAVNLGSNVTLFSTGNFSLTGGSFDHAEGTVAFVGATQYVSANQDLHSVVVNPQAYASFLVTSNGGALGVDGDLTFAGGGYNHLNYDSFAVAGNVTAASDGTFYEPGTIKFVGTGDQTLTGAGYIPQVVVNKPSGTLFASGNVSVVGGWQTQHGTADLRGSTINVVLAAYNNSQILSAANTTFGNLNIVGGYYSTLATTSDLNVAGDFTDSTSGGGYATFKAPAGTMTVAGNFTVNSGSSFDAHGGTVVFVPQTYFGQAGYHDQYVYAPGVVFNNVKINPLSTSAIWVGTTTGFPNFTPSDLTVNGKLTIGGSSTNVSFRGGRILASGDVETDNTGFGGYTDSNYTLLGEIVISGSGNQTITDRGELPSVTINKTGGTLKFAGAILDVGGNWTYTAGNVDATGSTIRFDSFYSGQHIAAAGMAFNNVTINPLTNSGTYVDDAGTAPGMVVNGTLGITGVSTNVSLRSGTIEARGNVTTYNPNFGGFTDTTYQLMGTILIDGTGDQILGGYGKLPSVKIDKSSGTLTIPIGANLDIAGNWTYLHGNVVAATDSSTNIKFVGSYYFSQHVSGGMTFGNVTLAPVAVSGFYIDDNGSSPGMVVGGKLTLAGSSNTVSFRSGTLKALGDVLAQNTAFGGYDPSLTGTIELGGTGTQTLTAFVAAHLPNVHITNTSAVVTITGGTTVTFDNLTLDVGAKLSLAGGSKLTVAGDFADYGTVVETLTSTTAAPLVVNGKLTLSNTSNFVLTTSKPMNTILPFIQFGSIDLGGIDGFNLQTGVTVGGVTKPSTNTGSKLTVTV